MLDGDAGMGFTLIKAPPATRGAGICSLTAIQNKHCRLLFFHKKFHIFLTDHSQTLGANSPEGIHAPLRDTPLVSHFLVGDWGCAAVLAGQAVVAERVRDLQPARDEARQHPAVHRRREARLQHRRGPVAHHCLPREGGAALLGLGLSWLSQGEDSPTQGSHMCTWGTKGWKLKAAFALLLAFHQMWIHCSSFSDSWGSWHLSLLMEELFWGTNKNEFYLFLAS